ncbi:MAG: hypothetical protein NT123_22675 [Proteobacteria bacterium]|nr:hypothetical protein [Pseudomonadota bacterium]
MTTATITGCLQQRSQVPVTLPVDDPNAAFLPLALTPSGGPQPVTVTVSESTDHFVADGDLSTVEGRAHLGLIAATLSRDCDPLLCKAGELLAMLVCNATPSAWTPAPTPAQPGRLRFTGGMDAAEAAGRDHVLAPRVNEAQRQLHVLLHRLLTATPEKRRDIGSDIRLLTGLVCDIDVAAGGNGSDGERLIQDAIDSFLYD